MRVPLLVIGVAIASGCSDGSGGSMTAPTPAAVSTEPLFAARGGVYDTIGRPLAHARVEVTNGPQRGISVLTDDQGTFTFEQVFQSGFTARASKAGYRDEFAEIRPRSPGWFHLWSVNPTVSFSGGYTISFTADSACTSIPGYARRRSFDASSTGGGATILVSLGGGSYGGPGAAGYFNNVLYAGVFENTLRLYLSDPPLFERFPQGSYLVVSGEAEGSIGELPATLPLSGHFVYCLDGASVDEPKCAVTEVSCQSSKHQLTIARR
jgi:hypothetical protein